MILELQHIYKNYDQDKLVVPVLKDVSLQIEEGEYVAIMGPSGSGKTTLMNIVGCLDLPTSGTYILDGRPVSELKEKELTRVRRDTIGFVFQNFQLMPRESALDNVCLPLIYAGVSKKDRRQMGMEALERVGLSDRADFKPTQLSGGQKQRVAIARAMVNHPKLLLADEPTGALDAKTVLEEVGLGERMYNFPAQLSGGEQQRVAIARALAKNPKLLLCDEPTGALDYVTGKSILKLLQDTCHKKGMTVIVITHNSALTPMADRIVRIRNGRVAEMIQNENPTPVEEIEW